MSIRTTAEAIRAIIEVDDAIIPTDNEMDPFIEAASALVDEVCDVADNGYTDARLELIERWLSAHFYTIRDPRIKTETADEVSATYESNTGLGLASSRYGQMAMAFDTKGGLAALDSRIRQGGVRRMAVHYLGRRPEEML